LPSGDSAETLATLGILFPACHSVLTREGRLLLGRNLYPRRTRARALAPRVKWCWGRGSQPHDATAGAFSYDPPGAHAPDVRKEAAPPDFSLDTRELRPAQASVARRVPLFDHVGVARAQALGLVDALPCAIRTTGSRRRDLGRSRGGASLDTSPRARTRSPACSPSRSALWSSSSITCSCPSWTASVACPATASCRRRCACIARTSRSRRSSTR